jgi:parvulin-like peptidyl-prolyl isomerase
MAEALPSVEEATLVPESVALVNGEGISEEMYQRSLALYRDAQAQAGTLLATEDVEQVVLNDLIARLLLAQAARAEGFATDESMVQDRLSKLIEDAGGQAVFDDWLSQHGYSADAFIEELSIEIEAGWKRTQITEAVPSSAEQVLARQILLSDLFQAERLLAQLEGGTPFETVVINNDPQRLGTLGWFPRGYLFQSEVEEAAFALQPGETSGIVESVLGFHLIEVLERDSDRELSPQARLQLQMLALDDWLVEELSKSDIEVFLP